MPVFFRIVLIVFFSFLKIDPKTEIWFSHDYSTGGSDVSCGNLSAKFVDLVLAAKFKIWIAVYMITDLSIAEALIKVKKARPKIDIQIIVDETSIEIPSGKALLLGKEGIKVFVYDFYQLRCLKNKNGKQPVKKEKKVLKVCKGLPGPKYALMHNKYAIFDDKTVWTGSFNLTPRANFHNQENALISTNKSVVKKTSLNFESLLLHSNFLTEEMIAEATSDVEAPISRGPEEGKVNLKRKSSVKKIRKGEDWEAFFGIGDFKIVSLAKKFFSKIGGRLRTFV